MPLVPPYNLTQIWCLWSHLTIWPKFDACGPPLLLDGSLMPVVPPYHLTQLWCLWSPLTSWPKFDACGPPLTFEQNLMPVVPSYYLTQIWYLWSPLTIWPKFNACGPPLLFEPNLMPVVPPGPPLLFDPNVMRIARSKIMWHIIVKGHKIIVYYLVPPYYLTQIWCQWSPLTIWPKFDACGPPLPVDRNLMPVLPP